MPARGGGAASRDAARRVAEDLLRLTLDPGPAPRDDSEDAGSGASVVGDARDASPERAVAALERLYASESYEDVRSAVVSALPRVRHPARFALACIEGNNPVEAAKYISRVKDDHQQIDLYLQSRLYTEAVETALRRKDFYPRLPEILRACEGDGRVETP